MKLCLKELSVIIGAMRRGEVQQEDEIAKAPDNAILILHCQQTLSEMKTIRMYLEHKLRAVEKVKVHLDE
jgi:hypothetical protein